MLYGIDYGSKLAGTTVIAKCKQKDPIVELLQSKKKEDADTWLLNQVDAEATVFLDAPLSLPGVYTNTPDCQDYFYRAGDRALKAMSPMFLGGLTARAMKMKSHLSQKSVTCHEVYPGGLIRLLQFPHYQKKNLSTLPSFWEQLKSQLPFQVKTPPQNWHQVDALLALWSGFRFLSNTHESYGTAEEGVIVV